MFTSPSLVAQPADNPSAQLSNLVALVRGEIPVAKIEMELDEKIFSQDGFMPTNPLMLEAGWQGDSFFIRKSWDVISNKLITLNPGTVWGQNANTRWIVAGDSVHLSKYSNAEKIKADPVHQEVQVYKSLAEIGRRLGFPPSIVIESVTSRFLRMRTDKGEPVAAHVIFSETGSVRGFEYGITNSDVMANVIIEYDYASGERPDWLPAVVKVSAQEVMANGRRFAYSDTHRILKCEVGDLKLNNGFSPEMFLQGRQVLRSLIWSNGIGMQIEGTNVTPILPPDTPSAARQFDDKRSWIRVFVIGSILSISFVFLLLLKRGRIGEQQTKN